jgi:hypothetical protein
LGKYPPPWLSPIAPVKGLLAAITIRLCPLIGKPVSGDTAKMSRLSGDSGSTPFFISFSRK